MRKRSILFSLGLFMLTISFILSCGPTAQTTATKKEQGEYAKDMKAREPDLPKCDRPIGTIVARGFKCKAAACVGDRLVFGPSYTVAVSPRVLGEGLSDMLVTALVKTGCFKVLEREVLEEIKEELALSGVQPQQTLRGADFLLTGAVTALEMNASGMGGGGVVIPLPFLGGVGVEGSKNKAHIGLDLRIVRIKDAQVLLAEAVEGKSERWKFGIGGGGIFGTTIAGGWFEAFKNTPMEEATRDLIYHAVKLIVRELKPYASQLEQTAPVTPVAQPAPAPTVSPETPVRGDSQDATGGLRRPGTAFKHGDKVLWSENFSGCKIVPRSMRVVQGTAECVKFQGKKWVATIKGVTILEKTIPGFEPQKDWALEFTAYIKGGKGSYAEHIAFWVGKMNSIVSFKYNLRNEVYLADKELPKISANGEVHKVGIVKRGQSLSLFIDGKRMGTVTVDTVAMRRYRGKLFFQLFADDIETGDYAFITDIKLSQFTR